MHLTPKTKKEPNLIILNHKSSQLHWHSNKILHQFHFYFSPFSHHQNKILITMKRKLTSSSASSSSRSCPVAIGITSSTFFLTVVSATTTHIFTHRDLNTSTYLYKFQPQSWRNSQLKKKKKKPRSKRTWIRNTEVAGEERSGGRNRSPLDQSGGSGGGSGGASGGGGR